MKHWDKKVLTVMMEWDYGIPERGASLDKKCFYDNLRKLVNCVEPFWFDSYLNNTKKLQNDLIQKAQEFSPDLIFFIPYTDQFTLETLDKLKNDFETFSWFGDDQWRFESFSSKYAPHFSYVSTTDPWSLSKYKKLGTNPVLSEWAGQTYSFNIGPLKENENYEYNVSFIGGYNEVRGWFIKQLSKYGIQVDCFGAGWSNGRIGYEDMEQVFRKSKINLNISNSVNQDIRFIFGGVRNFARWVKSAKRAEQVKARNFEIPLAGGFQLSNYSLGLERHWIIGREIAVYNNVEECAQQIRYYLEYEEQRRLITNNSYRRAIKEHTYLHRLEKILEEIWS